MTTTPVTATTKNHHMDEIQVESDCFLSFESVVEELKQQQKRTRPIAKRPILNTDMTVDNDCFLSFESVVAELVSIRMEQISDEWDRSWDRNSDDGDY